ncbi:MAG: hypothetical protein H7062_08230 [Candidatus Saccharimonas sp.]|nr:hypothetical protein [Planctomycetaceae bacterium]
MKPYTVVWPKSVLNDLTTLWLESTERDKMTHSAEQLHRWLSTRPEKSREEREGLRRLVAPPLQILFHISEPDRLVQVDAVKLAEH